jgi:hypothetical protein
MARLSDGGTGSRIIVSTPNRATTESPWSLESYPGPDPAFAVDSDRETAISLERLFWRESRTVAYGAGKPHPVDEEPLLVGWDEMMAPPDTLPTKRETRR